MLDKIGIIGDAKTAFNRLGIDTLAVVCVGGSSGTAVKVVTCDTVGGDYTDFLTLKADAENINEGFCFSLVGAKKFVKITGCDNAIGIVGDCDYDVKKVTFNTVTVAGADLENNKTATIDVSTYTEPVEIEPTAGKDGMKKATVTLSNIPSGGSVTAYSWAALDGSEDVLWFPINEAPADTADYLNKCAIRGRANNNDFYIQGFASDGDIYTRVSDSEFTVSFDGGETHITYRRNPAEDFTIW
jgi:hypothetical protein